MGCACGCSMTALERAANPAARKIAAIGPTANVAGLFPQIITPGDVSDYIKRLDPSFRSTTATVERCANLPLEDAQGWGEFNAEWRAVADAGVHLFQSWEAQYAIIQKFEGELGQRQATINAVCPLSTPIVNGGSSFPWLPVLAIGGLAVVVGAVGYSFYRTAEYAGGRAKHGRDMFDRAIDRQLAARLGEPGAAAAPKKKSLPRKSTSTALARRR